MPNAIGCGKFDSLPVCGLHCSLGDGSTEDTETGLYSIAFFRVSMTTARWIEQLYYHVFRQFCVRYIIS